MSTEETGLLDFQTAKEISEMDHDKKPNWEPHSGSDTGSSEICINCGSQVTQDFARVFGDNQDKVVGCPDCKTFRELKEGAVER